MMNVRSIFYSVCMVGELVIFMYIYITGSHGSIARQNIEHSYAEIQKSCTQLECDINSLQASLHQWEKYPFYTEQRARQQLYMGNPEEIWYWYGG